MPRPQSQAGGRALSSVAFETPAGEFTAHFSAGGLAQLDFPHQARPSRSLNRGASIPELGEWTALTRDAIRAILNGERPAGLPPLDVSAGTAFQQRVWAALRRIPAGKTKSYGEIAEEVGSPKATRAVGAACGANPIPILIPCHRVLAANAGLGGFSCGLDWKVRLLAAEGVGGFELALQFK